MSDHIQQIADIIRFAAEYTPYWTDDPATHQCPYENAAKALLEAGYGEMDEYEYGIQYYDAIEQKWIVIGKRYGYGLPSFWTNIEDREEYIDELQIDYVNTTFMLVKRRKAGKVETV